MLLWLLLLAARSLSAQSPSLTPFETAKARSLLERQLPCLGCHELDGRGGRVGPSLTSVTQRRSPAYIAAMIADPQRVVPGAAMPRTPMTPATRALIARYLARGRVPADPNIRAGAAAPRTPRAPGALYAKWCASCHGHRGDGAGTNAPHLPVRPAAHADAAVMSARPDDALFDVIAGGGVVAGKSARMPAFGETLTPAEIRSLVAHIRTLCRCEGPAWSVDGSNR